MSKLVLELQKDAMDSKMPLTDLLRKSFVVAKKLGIEEFQLWIQDELNGYSGEREIPNYRNVFGDVKAWNPYNGYIPVIVQDSKISNLIRNREINQPISELENLSKKEDGVLYVSFPQKIENMLMDGTDPTLRPTLHISSNSICGILDVVRNTVLEWSLKLEEEGILGDGMSFSNGEKSKAKANSNVNIQNFQGILGNVSESYVSQEMFQNITKGDFGSLSQFLQNKGISEDDINDLQKCIKAEPVLTKKNTFGEKVGSWIGEMVSKAASGSWKIGLSVASGLLANAINSFYGF